MVAVAAANVLSCWNFAFYYMMTTGLCNCLPWPKFPGPTGGCVLCGQQALNFDVTFCRKGISKFLILSSLCLITEFKCFIWASLALIVSSFCLISSFKLLISASVSKLNCAQLHWNVESSWSPLSVWALGGTSFGPWNQLNYSGWCLMGSRLMGSFG